MSGSVRGGTEVRRPSASRRQEIIDAAVRLMHDSGFVGTSVREIGAAVGMLSGSLYYHFREKEDILYAVQLMLNERISAIIPKVEDSGLGALGKIRLLIALHLDMVDANLALCHVGYTEYRHLKPDQVRDVQGPQREYRDFLARLIAEGQRTGEVHADLDPRTCAGAVFGLLNSVIWWRQPTSRPSTEELVATYERILISGLSAPPAA